jgi:hypothetical protein
VQRSSINGTPPAKNAWPWLASDQRVRSSATEARWHSRRHSEDCCSRRASLAEAQENGLRAYVRRSESARKDCVGLCASSSVAAYFVTLS